MWPQTLKPGLPDRTMASEAHMLKELHRFWGRDEGQDLVEYTFLVALVALGTVSLLTTQGGAVSSVWVTANTTMQNAALVAR